MQWYRTGTITVTNGSATVTGASTLWSDVGTLDPGDILNAPDGKLYEILTINSNTGIALNSVYLGSSLSGQAYSIMPIGLLPSTLAQSVKTTLATANTALASTVRYDINSMGLSLTQQQNARTNIAALSALDVGCGYLIKSVAGGVDVTLTAVEASNQIIAFTGTLTANINVIFPAAAREFVIANSTSGAFTLTVKTAGGTGLPVAQNKNSLIVTTSTAASDAISSVNSGLLVTGVVNATTGLNITGNGGFFNSASKFGIDNNGTATRFYSSGANSSTRGGYEFHITDSVGSLDTIAGVVDNNGNWLFGVTADTNVPTTGVTIRNTSVTVGNIGIGHASGTATGNPYINFAIAGAGIGSITQNGTTAVLYNTASDYRLKTDVSTIPGSEALARLAAVRPVDFTWISDGSKDAGFIAHEFQATYSRNVTGEKDGTEQQEYEVTPAVPATHDADGTELTAAIPAVMGTRTVPKYQQMDNSAAVPDLVAAVTYLAQQHATIAADFAAYKTAHP